MQDVLSPAPRGADELIKDGDIQSFTDDVIKASQTRPVLVDFWADWCGPCKQLMPMLEQAVQAAGGAVSLVKINADQNQTLCAQLHIQSLPTVMAFWQGQPVDGFQGALPGSQIKQFIDRIVQISGGAGMADNGLAAALEQADALREAGDIMNALSLYQQILEADPSNVPATLGYSEAAIATGQGEAVRDLILAIPADQLKDAALKARADKIIAALDLAKLGDPSADMASLEAQIEADPQNHEARYKLAEAKIARGDMAGAAESLLASLMRDLEWQDGAARALLLKLFEAAGQTDPFTLKYRRRLSSLIFS